MIGQQAYEIALAKTEDALRRSENRRLASLARHRHTQATTKPVLIDAIGGLIALGTRLVSDPHRDTHQRPAA